MYNGDIKKFQLFVGKTKSGHGPKISIFWKAQKRFDLEQKQFVHRLLINFRGNVFKKKKLEANKS